MSDKSVNKYGRRKIVNRNEIPCANTTQNSAYVNDVTKNFDCLKISILQKASRASGEFDKVTLGPDAEHKNDCSSNCKDEEQLKTNSPLINGTTSSRSNITFSIKKILLENELQRREKVKMAVERKKREMEKSQKEIQDELSQLLSRMAIQREKESAEKLASLEAEEEQIAQQLEIDRKNEVQRQRVKESEEISRKIVPYRDSFQAKWRDIANVSKACRDKNSATRLLAPHAARLKDLSIQMEFINEKAKVGDLTPEDIKVAEIIVQCNDEIFQLFKADIDHIEALYDEEIARREMEVKRAELAAQEEAQRIKQMQDMQNAAKVPQQSNNIEPQEIRHEEQPLNTQIQQVSEVDNGTIQLPQYPNVPVSTAPAAASETPSEHQNEKTSKYNNNESLKIYEDSRQYLDNYTSTYKDFIKSDAMKKFKLECQKTLNLTINTISHASRDHLIDKYEKLKLFLSGKTSPNILLNPQAEAYSKSLLAQKIVDQGDTTISRKQDMAFSFAAIAVALWNDWPDFGSLLLARFRTKSPFLVPAFLLPRSDQSEEDYYKSLGCKYNEDGTPEKPEQFWKRLRGLMYLYASILVTKQKRGIGKPHPHGLGNAWRWLADTVNIEPRCDIAEVCATLVYTMLEVTGNDLWKTYPNQFPKMLFMYKNVYYEKLKGANSVVSIPISRLGDFLNDAAQKGFIPPPKGQLPPNFW